MICTEPRTWENFRERRGPEKSAAEVFSWNFFLKNFEWCDDVMRGQKSWFVCGEASEGFKISW